MSRYEDAVAGMEAARAAVNKAAYELWEATNGRPGMPTKDGLYIDANDEVYSRIGGEWNTWGGVIAQPVLPVRRMNPGKPLQPEA